MKMIDERAKEYANVGATLFMDSPKEEIIYRYDLARAYAAGAKEEHDELTVHYEAEIVKYKQDLDESREREKIACKAVAEKREEIARLTKWHDPKAPPEGGKEVLLKLRFEGCDTPGYTVGEYWGETYLGDDLGRKSKIIGWREIHE